jgi:predicted enzyme involved in methoxymalonyl-ACP biosynthesis
MGRNVERAMVAFAAQYCAGLGLREVRADYLFAAKNKPRSKF